VSFTLSPEDIRSLRVIGCTVWIDEPTGEASTLLGPALEKWGDSEVDVS
jgi:hypothetical protein